MSPGLKTGPKCETGEPAGCCSASIALPVSSRTMWPLKKKKKPKDTVYKCCAETGVGNDQREQTKINLTPMEPEKRGRGSS